MIGTALVTALLDRGDEVVALARSDSAAATCSRSGVQVHRGAIEDEQTLAAAMEGCELAFNVAGLNKFCVTDPGPMMRANVDGAVAAVRAAKHAGVPRLVHTSSAATLGEAPGVVANEWTPHRGWYLSNYEQSKTLGERAAIQAAAELQQDVVYVNPSSVQGPGRAGGTGRFLIAFLDGRLKVFVDTWVSLVDIQDCVAGHLLAAERGEPGERYLLNGIRMRGHRPARAGGRGRRRHPQRRGWLPARSRPSAAAAAELAFRARGKHPPVCREMVRTLLHGHRYDGTRAERELGLVYTPAEETLRRTVDWARAEGLLQARRALSSVLSAQTVGRGTLSTFVSISCTNVAGARERATRLGRPLRHLPLPRCQVFRAHNVGADGAGSARADRDRAEPTAVAAARAGLRARLRDLDAIPRRARGQALPPRVRARAARTHAHRRSGGQRAVGDLRRLNRDLAVTGAMLHDIGKLDTYADTGEQHRDDRRRSSAR